MGGGGKWSLYALHLVKNQHFHNTLLEGREGGRGGSQKRILYVYAFDNVDNSGRPLHPRH